MIYCYLKQAIELLYSVKTSDSGIIVYPEFTHMILEKLEQLHCGIYHEKYHQNDPSPVCAEGACIGDFVDKTAFVESTATIIV